MTKIHVTKIQLVLRLGGGACGGRACPPTSDALKNALKIFGTAVAPQALLDWLSSPSNLPSP